MWNNLGTSCSLPTESRRNRERSFAREKVTRMAGNAPQGPVIAIAYGMRKWDCAHISKNGQASRFPEMGFQIVNKSWFLKTDNMSNNRG